MNTIVDTCIWSYALRRRDNPMDHVTEQLNRLIQQRKIVMLGAIRQ